MIKPTVGRVVLFEWDENQEEPLAAIVTKVWNDRLVNLCTFRPNGDTEGMTSIRLAQPGDEVLADAHCYWMPYQIGQAAKYEELEAKTATEVPPKEETPA